MSILKIKDTIKQLDFDFLDFHADVQYYQRIIEGSKITVSIDPVTQILYISGMKDIEEGTYYTKAYATFHELLDEKDLEKFFQGSIEKTLNALNEKGK